MLLSESSYSKVEFVTAELRLYWEKAISLSEQQGKECKTENPVFCGLQRKLQAFWLLFCDIFCVCRIELSIGFDPTYFFGFSRVFWCLLWELGKFPAIPSPGLSFRDAGCRLDALPVTDAGIHNVAHRKDQTALTWSLCVFATSLHRFPHHVHKYCPPAKQLLFPLESTTSFWESLCDKSFSAPVALLSSPSSLSLPRLYVQGRLRPRVMSLGHTVWEVTLDAFPKPHLPFTWLHRAVCRGCPVIYHYNQLFLLLSHC